MSQRFTPADPSLVKGKAVSPLHAVDEPAAGSEAKLPRDSAGLNNRAVLLSPEEAPAFEALVAQYQAEYQPTGLRETELVQSLAETSWRLRRIPALEMAFYYQGRIESTGAFDDHDPALRASLVELFTYQKFERQLRNLHLQEGRLHRRYNAEMKELRQLQNERRQRAAPAGSSNFQLSEISPCPAGSSNFQIAESASDCPSQFEFSNHPDVRLNKRAS